MIDDLEREGKAHRDISFTNILFVDFNKDPSVISESDGIPMSCISSPLSDSTLSTTGANDPVPLPKGTPTMQDIEMRGLPVSAASVNDPVPVDGMAPPVNELRVKKLMVAQMNHLHQRFKCHTSIMINFDYGGLVNEVNTRHSSNEKTYSRGGRTVSTNLALPEC